MLSVIVFPMALKHVVVHAIGVSFKHWGLVRGSGCLLSSSSATSASATAASAVSSRLIGVYLCIGRDCRRVGGWASFAHSSLFFKHNVVQGSNDFHSGPGLDSDVYVSNLDDRSAIRLERSWVPDGYPVADLEFPWWIRCGRSWGWWCRFAFLPVSCPCKSC